MIALCLWRRYSHTFWFIECVSSKLRAKTYCLHTHRERTACDLRTPNNTPQGYICCHTLRVCDVSWLCADVYNKTVELLDKMCECLWEHIENMQQNIRIVFRMCGCAWKNLFVFAIILWITCRGRNISWAESLTKRNDQQDQEDQEHILPLLYGL